MASKAHELLTLAAEQFPDLTDAEKKLLHAVTAGDIANCRSPNDAENDPWQAYTWNNSRIIRAQVIRWLYVNPEATRHINPHGIDIDVARIEGWLDLAYVTLSVPFALRRCWVGDGVALAYADTRTIWFSGSILGASDGTTLDAVGAHVHGDMFLDGGFQAYGSVRLVGASIGGDLTCTGGMFHHPEGPALWADRAQVGGHARLSSGFRAYGPVRLVGASIGGHLTCKGGTFLCPGRLALWADRAQVGGIVFLNDGFRAEGTVRLVDGRVGQLVDDEASWPAPGNLQLDGFVYTAIAAGPIDAKTRLCWLARQPSRPFRPQPYEQLAKVLRESGHEADAKRVLIAKERARWRNRGLGCKPRQNIIYLRGE